MSFVGSDGHPGPYNGYKKAPIPYIKHRSVKLGPILGTKILPEPFIGYDDHHGIYNWHRSSKIGS